MTKKEVLSAKVLELANEAKASPETTTEASVLFTLAGAMSSGTSHELRDLCVKFSKEMLRRIEAQRASLN